MHFIREEVLKQIVWGRIFDVTALLFDDIVPFHEIMYQQRSKEKEMKRRKREVMQAQKRIAGTESGHCFQLCRVNQFSFCCATETARRIGTRKDGTALEIGAIPSNWSSFLIWKYGKKGMWNSAWVKNITPIPAQHNGTQKTRQILYILSFQQWTIRCFGGKI